MNNRKVNEGFCNQVIYEIAEILQREMGSSSWIEQLLGLFTYKYISDRYIESETTYKTLANELSFSYLYELSKGNDIENIFEIIDNIYKKIEELEEFNEVFILSYFNNVTYLNKENNNISSFRKILSLLNELKLKESEIEYTELPKNIMDYILEAFMQCHDKRRPPHEIGRLLRNLLKPEDNSEIYDCVCGDGTLLLDLLENTQNKTAYLYGEEVSMKFLVYSKMNMIVNNIKNHYIKLGNVLDAPQYTINDELQKFDIVVAMPPFSMSWNRGNNDKYNRFEPFIPPKSKADFAFILHMLSSLKVDGKMAVVLPHGILFRGGTEVKIRKELIENNYIDAVIGLPSNLLTQTAIQLCIVIFKKNRSREDILFIDASENFEKQRKNNILRDEDLLEIIDTYTLFKTKDKFSNVVTKEKIINNDYNLNIPMYVDRFDEAEKIDLREISIKINGLNKKLRNKEDQIESMISEMDLLWENTYE